MLTQYKNKNTFNTNGPSSTQRFSDAELELLVKNVNEIPKSVPGLDSVELHIYSNDTWITGNHNVKLIAQDPYYKFDIVKELYNLKLTTGNFRFVVNFFNDIIGSYDKQYLYIDDISPDRTELRLGLVPTIDAAGKNQFVDYAALYDTLPQTGITDYKQYVLNFSRNKTFAYVNSVVVGDYLYIRLLDPLPIDQQVNFKCWLAEEIKLPYTDLVSLLPQPVVSPTPVKLNGPNWNASVSSLSISSEGSVSAGTDLKSWNELLGSSTSTSQQLVDTYFSGSLKGVELNIDFRDFNNYIFYSSAEERLHNFKFKLDLIDYYNSKISTLSLIQGTTALDDIANYTANKNTLIGGFDSFEKYLYFESSSLLFNNDIPLIKPAVESITGSYVFPAPKSNSTAPYIMYSVTSSQFTNWYSDITAKAVEYDNLNLNKLTNYLPESIRYNEDNAQILTFVNMLGHHYDILHTYIKHAALLYKQEENPKIGLPNEMLANVAKQFGWNLSDGNNQNDLWKYALGTDASGAPLTGSNSVGDPSVSGKNMTYAVWRRIVNNLPYLLKSKGTKRSIQALIACYGIPSSLISINEYGGPRVDRVPVYEKEVSNYSLDLINNTTGNININYNQPIGAIELRFFTDDVRSNPSMPSSMNLITVSGSQINVKLDFARGTLGTATIYDNNSNSATTGEIELFDGGWVSMLINKNGSDLDLFLNKSKYGKIVSKVSASITSPMPIKGSVKLGVSSSVADRLLGNLQELRLWTGSLTMNAFDNHTTAAGSYNGTYDSYDELIFRLPLNRKINHTLTSSLSGVQPVNNNISASFSAWPVDKPYSFNSETYYFDGISLGPTSNDDNKVRIDTTAQKPTTLSLNSSVQKTVFDPDAIDANRIAIYYSPQTMINEDIISQLGYIDLDSYIGDTSVNSDTEYSELKKQANTYWKKYSNKQGINDYLKMFSLFDQSLFTQLKQLLPSRAEKVIGIVIQPNILERNVSTHQPSISRKYDDLQAEIIPVDENFISATNNNLNLEVTIPEVYKIQSAIDNVVDMYLTGSDESRYGATKYVREYINTANGVYIKDTTPYWMSYGVVGMISNDNIIATHTQGTLNNKFNGCKLTSKDFNIKSNDTVDNGPVVELFDVKGNQLIIDKNILPTI